MASKSSIILSVLIPLLFITTTTTSLSEDVGGECGYLVYVQTGAVKRAGTHSTISLQLKTESGQGISVPDLEQLGGVMGPNYNYCVTSNSTGESGSSVV